MSETYEAAGGPEAGRAPSGDGFEVPRGRGLAPGGRWAAGATEPERSPAWLTARRAAMDGVLDAVAGSEWAGSLVLRGSALMARWFGERARHPGDLDFIVRVGPHAVDAPETERMLAGLAAAAEGRAGLTAAGVAHDEIWTYDRVPGRRMTVPWRVPGLPGGRVQLDFAFGEELACPPEPVRAPGGAGVLWAAPPSLSLAWKVLWLTNDSCPQGKDLYDAVLLAERFRVDWALLSRVLAAGEETRRLRREEVLPWLEAQLAGYLDWENFEAEYPGPAAACPEQECRRRLAAALGAMLAG
ncbi:nucleotidyl transferase AbiEii/AbiGii toxin family protein [Streptomyces sp. BI20]|uniref:nucleotidyl transferase AbiEii/AbiGii toxin family protein n=1 Tax=Streptomyces sp. BI20 TaxID=3403460 RepID=UPI003C74127D